MTPLQALSVVLALQLPPGEPPVGGLDALRCDPPAAALEVASPGVDPAVLPGGLQLSDLLEDFEVKDCTTGNSGGCVFAGCTPEPCYTLTTAHTGQGADPTFFPCGNVLPVVPCPAANQFYASALVFLDAAPASGWVVGGWVNADFPGPGATQNQVTMPTGNLTVTVQYVQCFALTTTHTPPEGGGDPTTSPARSAVCANDGEYLAGEVVQLQAQPASGWTVKGWTNTDNDGSRSLRNTVTMPAAALTVGVDYQEPCFVLKRSRTPSQGGAVPTASPVRSGACASDGQYVAGEKIELTAAPAAGWEVQSWRGTDDDDSTSTTNTATMPAAGHSVLAVYTRPIVAFDSGFEEAGLCDWSTRFCDACDLFECHLSAGEVSVPLGSYRTATAGEHIGVLRGPEDADFDLLLQWWNGSHWITVASRLSPTSFEEVLYEGEAGLYRWQVVAAAGGGRFDLAIDYPGLASAQANGLEQVKKPRRQGKRSLRASFDKTSKDRDYLVDRSPEIGGGESRYEASFWLLPHRDLFLKGQKHQIFQLAQAGQGAKAEPIVEMFLRSVRGGRFGLFVRVRTEGAGRPKSPVVEISGGEWTPVRIVWQAAEAAGRNDGSLELYVGDRLEWSRNLPNASHRVDRALLGQVSRGSKKSNGLLHYDDFRSTWSE